MPFSGHFGPRKRALVAGNFVERLETFAGARVGREERELPEIVGYLVPLCGVDLQHETLQT